MRKKQTLDPNQILAKEFEYAAQTAFQANEDRVRIFTYFIGTATTLIAVTIFPELSNPFHLVIFIALFIGFSFLGFFSFLKLLKLRVAWVNSVKAMSKIKQYYIDDNESLKEAFRWTQNSVPSPGKKWTIAFLMALTTALITSISCLGAVLLITFAYTDNFNYPISIIVTILCFLLHILIWLIVTANINK